MTSLSTFSRYRRNHRPKLFCHKADCTNLTATLRNKLNEDMSWTQHGNKDSWRDGWLDGTAVVSHKPHCSVRHRCDTRNVRISSNSNSTRNNRKTLPSLIESVNRRIWRIRRYYHVHRSATALGSTAGNTRASDIHSTRNASSGYCRTRKNQDNQ